MKSIYLIASLIIGLQAHSQTKDNLVLPSPVIGWDSLTNLVKYPEIARRAGIQGAYYAKFLIDTLGGVQRIKVFKISDLYENEDTSVIAREISLKLKSTKWIPAITNNAKLFYVLTIPFVFILNQQGQVGPILKYTERSSVHVNFDESAKIK